MHITVVEKGTDERISFELPIISMSDFVEWSDTNNVTVELNKALEKIHSLILTEEISTQIDFEEVNLLLPSNVISNLQRDYEFGKDNFYSTVVLRKEMLIEAINEILFQISLPENYEVVFSQ